MWVCLLYIDMYLLNVCKCLGLSQVMWSVKCPLLLWLSAPTWSAVSQLREELDALGATKDNVDVMLMDIQRSREELDHLIPEYDVVVRYNWLHCCFAEQSLLVNWSDIKCWLWPRLYHVSVGCGPGCIPLVNAYGTNSKCQSSKQNSCDTLGIMFLRSEGRLRKILSLDLFL